MQFTIGKKFWIVGTKDSLLDVFLMKQVAVQTYGLVAGKIDTGIYVVDGIDKDKRPYRVYVVSGAVAEKHGFGEHVKKLNEQAAKYTIVKGRMVGMKNTPVGRVTTCEEGYFVMEGEAQRSFKSTRQSAWWAAYALAVYDASEAMKNEAVS